MNLQLIIPQNKTYIAIALHIRVILHRSETRIKHQAREQSSARRGVLH